MRALGGWRFGMRSAALHPPQVSWIIHMEIKALRRMIGFFLIPAPGYGLVSHLGQRGAERQKRRDTG